jgi:hypothetical protein
LANDNFLPEMCAPIAARERLGYKTSPGYRER